LSLVSVEIFGVGGGDFQPIVPDVKVVQIDVGEDEDGREYGDGKNNLHMGQVRHINSTCLLMQCTSMQMLYM
jgi:hypothetical protein